MKSVPSIVIAAALLFGATGAFAQVTTAPTGATSPAPGAAPNGTTPGATGDQPQSLQDTGPGEGLGYSQPAPSLGVSPDALGSPNYNPNASGGEQPGSPSVGTPNTAGSPGVSGSTSSGG